MASTRNTLPLLISTRTAIAGQQPFSPYCRSWQNRGLFKARYFNRSNPVLNGYFKEIRLSIDIFLRC
jgi:hypothetical protein